MEEVPRLGQGKNGRTNVDTSLLLWLQLTGVNSNHKAWRTAVCVSVVMWASLALRNRKMCLFLTKVTFLSPNRTLDNLPFHQLTQVPNMLQVWFQTALKKRKNKEERMDQLSPSERANGSQLEL